MLAQSLLPEGWEGQWEAERKGIPPLASRLLHPTAAAAPGTAPAAATAAATAAERVEIMRLASALMERAIAIGPARGMVPSTPHHLQQTREQPLPSRPQTSVPPEVPHPPPDSPRQLTTAGRASGPLFHRRAVRDPRLPLSSGSGAPSHIM